MGLNQSICQPEGMQKNIGFMVKQKSFLFDKVYTCDYKLMSHYECKNVKCKKMQPISVALRSFSNSAIFKSISSLNIIWVILPFQIIHCTVIRGIEIFYLYIYSRGEIRVLMA